MNLKTRLFNKNLLIGILVIIPIIIILLIILFRSAITPSNEDIINDLRNTKFYSCKVNYIFKNSKTQVEENTIQYYGLGKGSRIEFLDGYQRVKVYKGSEIKVEDDSGVEYSLDKDIDKIYPLAFINNILYDPQNCEVNEVKAEWGEGTYLKVNIEYSTSNKHLNKAEFYIDKDKKIPVLLKVLDDDDKERIIITYTDFKKETDLSDDLF